MQRCGLIAAVSPCSALAKDSLICPSMSTLYPALDGIVRVSYPVTWPSYNFNEMQRDSLHVA